jgi:NADPH:quinone reductase-like Zn-dependent oxidoreductase
VRRPWAAWTPGEETTTVKAVVIREFGPPEGLEVVDLPDPAPAAGQVLIAVEAIGVGGVDAVIRSGALAGYGFTPGHVPGSEVAGTVTAVGAGVDASWVGRRVWAFTGTGGGYVEQAVAAVQDVQPLPEELSAADAVTLGGSGIVAHFALAHAHFAAGESVLVRGASGGIGVCAVQLAAQAGASAVAVTTSSAARGERLRALGATHVLDRDGGNGGTGGGGDTGGGGTGEGGGPGGGGGPGDGGSGASGGPDAPAAYDVVVDIVGGPHLPAFFDRLRPNGRLVAVGIVAGPPPADFGMKLMADFRRSLSFATFSSDTVPPADRAAVRAAQFTAATHGTLTSVVHGVLPLADAARAHRAMADGEVFGRVVLTP